MEKANFGFMGLGVMGHMLALNMERHGFRVAGYDIDAEKVKAFGTKYPGKNLIACNTLEEFLNALERPRRIMMMVPAGKPVDAAIASLKPILERGDLLIDGGNTFFTDTERRSAELEALGIIYIGTGVSGGEQGALWGPAIMPGGQPEAWELVKPIFEAIAAKVNDEPCVAYMGPRGAGHYVKMVHNGIEYGDMQLIAEAYDVLHRGLGLSNDRLHEVFSEWNRGELESYLIEITADIFAKLDDESGQSVIDLILDEAQQKGTGKWASQNALDLGAPIPTINAAVEIAHHLGLQGRACRRVANSDRPATEDRSRSAGRDRRGARCAVCRQDLLVRAGLRLDAAGQPGIQVSTQLWRDRAHLARRLHHPRALPQRHPPGVCAPTRSAQPADRSGIRAGDERAAEFAAQSGGPGSREWHSRAGLQFGAGLLRCVSQCAPARESDAGAA